MKRPITYIAILVYPDRQTTVIFRRGKFNKPQTTTSRFSNVSSRNMHRLRRALTITKPQPNFHFNSYPADTIPPHYPDLAPHITAFELHLHFRT